MAGGESPRHIREQVQHILALMREFEKEKIGFAYPTRSLFLKSPVRVELTTPRLTRPNTGRRCIIAAGGPRHERSQRTGYRHGGRRG